jgi:hypothetical protein
VIRTHNPSVRASEGSSCLTPRGCRDRQVLKHYAIKIYGGSGGIAPTFLTSALDGGEWSASNSYRFASGERALSTHSIGGWVGPRTGLGGMEKRKIWQFRKSNLNRQARSLSLYRLSYNYFPYFRTARWCSVRNRDPLLTTKRRTSAADGKQGVITGAYACLHSRGMAIKIN